MGRIIQCLVVLAVTPGCLTSAPLLAKVTGTSSKTSTETSSSSTSSLAALEGARAAKIVFRQSNPSGSFDAAPANGTYPAPGSGHAATRVFNADGSLLALSPASSSWPKWLTRVEIGISGSANPRATESDCARFATATDETAQCDVGTPSAFLCGAASGLYRVSEYDCISPATTSDGNGGPEDPVYIRATFDRSKLHSYENLMLVLEYSAAVVTPPTTGPNACFSGGNLSLTQGCGDLNWNIYLKQNPYQISNPFLMLIPPAFSSMNALRLGAGVATKQVYVPLSGDASLNVLQISRISTVNFENLDPDVCNSDAGDANSPLCMGVIFYSLTLLRI